MSDQFEWNGLRFEVVDMDGKRIDKVLVTSGQKNTQTRASELASPSAGQSEPALDRNTKP